MLAFVNTIKDYSISIYVYLYIFKWYWYYTVVRFQWLFYKQLYDLSTVEWCPVVEKYHSYGSEKYIIKIHLYNS